MAKKYGLTKEQIKFITAKVEELGSVEAVLDFYKLKDDVSAFARDTAYNTFDQDYSDEEKPKKTAKKKAAKKKAAKKKTKKKATTVKRKRKIDVEEVLNED